MMIGIDLLFLLPDDLFIVPYVKYKQHKKIVVTVRNSQLVITVSSVFNNEGSTKVSETIGEIVG